MFATFGGFNCFNWSKLPNPFGCNNCLIEEKMKNIKGLTVFGKKPNTNKQEAKKSCFKKKGISGKIQMRNVKKKLKCLVISLE